MTDLDRVLKSRDIKKKKSRDITLPTKVCIVMVFLVVIYRCESWAIKKDEC